MSSFSSAVSQRPSPPLPTTLLAFLGLKLPLEPTQKAPSPPNPPEPPDPPDPPPTHSFTDSLVVVVSPLHSPHLNFATVLAVNYLGSLSLLLTFVSYTEASLAFTRAFTAVCSSCSRFVLVFSCTRCQICSPFSWQPRLAQFPFPIILTLEDALWEDLCFTEEDVTSKSIRDSRDWNEAFVPPPSSPPAPPPEPPSPPAPPKPPDPPDLQICPSSSESHAQPPFIQQLTGPQRVHHDFEPLSPPYPRPVPPCRKSIPLSISVRAPRRSNRRRSMLLISGSSNVNLGFHCLDQNWVHCLLGQKGMGVLLGQKWRSFLVGLTIPTPSPLIYLYRASCLIFLDLFRFKPSHPIEPRFLCSLVLRKVPCSFSASITIAAPFPQVFSCYSLSDSSNLGRYWMVVDSVTLALWNSGIVLTPSMILDTPGSTFVLFGGTLIALVRNFTAVCRFYFELTLLEVTLSQIGKRCLLSFSVPGILVHRGFHSPHLSFKEPIFLPNTSLVFSGIVIGSIVVKTILLVAEARIVVQDSSRSAIADWLTMEALFPPPCGFVKDYRFEDACFIEWPCLDSFSVELMSSPLSLSLYVSFVVVFSLSFYSITWWIVVFAVSALCRFVVSSSNGG